MAKMCFEEAGYVVVKNSSLPTPYYQRLSGL